MQPTVDGGDPHTTVQGQVDAPAQSGRGRELLGATFWQGASRIFPLILNLVLTPYFITGLGFGRWSVYLLMNTIVWTISTINGGLAPAALRFFAIYAGSGNKKGTTRLLVTASALMTALGVVFAAAGLLLTPMLLTFFKVSPELKSEADFFLRTMIIIIAVLMVRNIFQSLLFAHNKFKLAAIANLLGYVIYWIGMILSIEFGWGLFGAAWTFVAQQVLISVIMVVACLPMLVRAGIGWMPKAELFELFGFAWRAQVAGMVAVVTPQKDQLVAGKMLSAQESGPYGQGANFALQLRMIPLTAMEPIQSSIGRSVGERGAEASRELGNKLQRIWVALVAGWLALGLPATYYGVRVWLPEGYAVISSDVAALSFVGVCATLLPIVLTAWCNTCGHPQVELRFTMVGLILNIAISIALAFPFGIMGVVMGTMFSQIMAAIWMELDARRTLPVRLESLLHGVPWLGFILALGLTWGLEFLAHPHLPTGSLGLLIAGLLALPGAVIYAILGFGLDTLRTYGAKVPVIGKLIR